MVKDGPGDDPRELIPRDDKEADTSEVREQQVDVLERHILLGLPHGSINLDIPRRSLRDLPTPRKEFQRRGQACVQIEARAGEGSEEMFSARSQQLSETPVTCLPFARRTH